MGKFPDNFSETLFKVFEKVCTTFEAKASPNYTGIKKISCIFLFILSASLSPFRYA